IPCWKIGAVREFANFGFSEVRIQEWSEDLMLGGSTMAGAEVESVVRVDSVCDRGKVAFPGQRVECREQFVLAVVTAIGGVGAIGGIFHFIRGDEFVANAGGADEGFEHRPIVSGKTWRESSHRKRPFAESVVRRPREISGVRATGERHDDGWELRQCR